MTRKTIQLKLGNGWYFLDTNSKQFRPVGNKRNFLLGDILYQNSAFYKVVPKRKLQEIGWSHAGKEIYRLIGENTNINTRKISKNKLLFAFKINADEEVQTCVNPSSFPPRRERNRATISDEIDNEAKNFAQNLSSAEARAKTLLHKIVHSDHRLKFQKSHHLIINSINHQHYRIDLKTAQVYNHRGVPLCVVVWGQYCNLPHYDRIIAKALTIAYAPQRISTL